MSLIRLFWVCIAVYMVIGMGVGIGTSIKLTQTYLSQEIDPKGESSSTDADQASGQMPAWFYAWVGPPELAQGTAVSEASKAAAQHQDRAALFLWQLGQGLLISYAVTGALLIAALLALWRWAQKPLHDFQSQIQSLSQANFISMPEPPVLEWVGLSKSLNLLVARVQLMLSERDQQLTQLQDKVGLDQLTGVSSRGVLMDRLKAELAALDERPPGSVVVIRVHDLVGMNQRCGRERTDDFLRAVATALRSRLYQLDDCHPVLARLNGADFGVFLPGITGSPLTQWLTHLSESMKSLYTDQLAETPNVAWIGASTYRIGETFSDVLTRADTMVMASENKCLPFCITSPVKKIHTIALAQWRIMIETALDSGKVHLVHRPVKGKDEQLVHMAASVTIVGPDHAVLTEDAFMSPAIRAGRSLDLNLRAIHLALLWLESNPGQMAVNVSTHSINRPIFLRRLNEMLSSARVDTGRLSIEVDERGLVESEKSLSFLTDMLQTFRCKVGIFNFGRHFSALPQLKHWRVDYIKLDAAFCNNIECEPGMQNFVRMVVELASSLGIEVIAAGRGDPWDMAILYSLGVNGIDEIADAQELVDAQA